MPGHLTKLDNSRKKCTVLSVGADGGSFSPLSIISYFLLPVFEEQLSMD